MKIFVGDHALDSAVVAVAGGIGPRQHQLVVEDVEALVLHGPHVEVANGDDVEHVEVIFAAEALLVPAHGALQRLHGPAAAVLLAGLDIDVELDVAARGRGEAVGHAGEIAADQREQIRRLGMGIMPDGEVPVGARHVAGGHGIAVGEQHRRLLARGFDAHGVNGEHIGTVEKIGDTARAFRLALGAVGAARAVKAGERGVGLRIAHRDGFEHERPVGHRGNSQGLVIEPVVRRGKLLAVEGHAFEGQILAVEDERKPIVRRLGVRTKLELGADAGGIGIEGEIKLDLVDEIVRRSIIFEELRSPEGLIHGYTTCPCSWRS